MAQINYPDEDIGFSPEEQLICKAETGKLEALKRLVASGVNCRAQDDKPLRYAAWKGHLDVVKFLHSQGSNIRAVDDQAIQFAAIYNHLDVVKYLTENGADITSCKYVLPSIKKYFDEVRAQRERAGNNPVPA